MLFEFRYIILSSNIYVIIFIISSFESFKFSLPFGGRLQDPVEPSNLKYIYINIISPRTLIRILVREQLRFAYLLGAKERKKTRHWRPV